MDYSSSPAVRLMTAIAADTGCQYEPFSQSVYLSGVGRRLGGPLVEGGIGHALCVAWLETVQTTGGDFVAQVGDLDNSPLLHRRHSFGPVEIGKSCSFGLSQAGVDALCAWLCAGADHRYCLVSSARHAMAASGSRLGVCSFFDPDCGIVTAASPRDLATCLRRYLGMRAISLACNAPGAEAWLTATTYRAPCIHGARVGVCSHQGTRVPAP